MSLNPFECLGEASSSSEDRERPKTPENQGNRAYIPETPRKKLKSKRKATSPPPKERSKEQSENKSTTYYLYLAKNAIDEALKAEKESQKEKYITDNDIQLLKESLEEILGQREIEIFPEHLENLETQRKFGYVQKEFEHIRGKIDQISTQIQKIVESASTTAPIPTITPIPASTPMAIPTKLMSFADIVKKGPISTGGIAPHPYTKIPQKEVPQKTSPRSYKDRRLVLNEAIKKEEQINPLKLRNQINKAFEEKKEIATPVVATVSKSFLGTSIILTTTEQFSAEFLTQNRAIWEPYFKFRNATKDTTWSKVVIHKIPLDIFGHEEGLDLLEDEIRTFNGLNPVSKPNWISSIENRRIKKHASAIISFETKAEADKAIRNRLYIAGASMRAVECISIKPNQCKRCQGFGHLEHNCSKDYNCSICAKNHPTRLHFCTTCKAKGVVCTHTEIKCINCQKHHQATDKICEKLQTPQGEEPNNRPKRFSHVEI